MLTDCGSEVSELHDPQRMTEAGRFRRTDPLHRGLRGLR
jgi:hypothetical protein